MRRSMASSEHEIFDPVERGLSQVPSGGGSVEIQLAVAEPVLWQVLELELQN